MGCCGSSARSLAAPPVRAAVAVGVRLRVLPTVDAATGEARVARCAVCPAAKVVGRFRQAVRCSDCECDVAAVTPAGWVARGKALLRRAKCPRREWVD